MIENMTRKEDASLTFASNQYPHSNYLHKVLYILKADSKVIHDYNLLKN
ncbi:hypothetical protein [Chryseobacterium glaciei]|nr:hypothetical protein [Chryseobacterium glaciei]